ncbi:MAG: cadherin-like beta sandwich domain-containing protein [Planctomycetota bacterium]
MRRGALALLALVAAGCGSSVEPPGGVELGLTGLRLSSGTLEPPFAPGVRSYAVACPVGTSALSVTATTASLDFELHVGGAAARSGEPSAAVPLDQAITDVVIAVRAGSGEVVEYTVSAARFDQRARLQAAQAGAGDALGRAPAIALDGDVLVVGAPLEDSAVPGTTGTGGDDGLADSGAAVVFVRRDGVWSQQALLKAANPGDGDQFGSSVAIAGEVIAVGAPWEDSAGSGVDSGLDGDDSLTSSGAVYLFRRSGEQWFQEAYVKALVPGLGDGFGERVALDGDTLAVGVPLEDSAGVGPDSGMEADDSVPNSGAVYVFERLGGGWTQTAYLKAPNTGLNDWFGKALALRGDTLAVGAPNEGSAASGVDGDPFDDSLGLSGAVFVFARSAGAWQQRAYLKALVPGAGDRFGSTLALGDELLAVGAPGEASAAVGTLGDATAQQDDTAPGAGAVLVFARAAGSWEQRAFLKATNTDAGDAFGSSLALGDALLLVGAPHEASGGAGVRSGAEADDGSAAAGAVYAFAPDGVGDGWQARGYLKSSRPGIGAAFGAAVAASGSALAASAPGDDDVAADSGAVYVFR